MWWAEAKRWVLAGACALALGGLATGAAAQDQFAQSLAGE
jgi:hypothetical protein